MESEDLI
jgi:hypothetical protein